MPDELYLMFCWLASKSLDHLAQLAIDIRPIAFKGCSAVVLSDAQADLGQHCECYRVVNLLGKITVMLLANQVYMVANAFDHRKSSLGYLDLGLSHG